MSLSFKRVEEDFLCDNCGASVEGDGYTNHCNICLWSKHVDINPGDRKEECRGLMIPKSVALRDKKYIIFHECKRCGVEKKNKISENDNFNAILDISRRQT